MDTWQANEHLSKQEVLFPNGNRAQLVAPTAGASAEDVIRALGIEKPKALIMVSGGAAGLAAGLRARLVQLFSRGIARAAIEAGALIVDGGTQSGVMEMMGQGVADRGRKTPLLGVAPSGKVTYPGGPADGSVEGGCPLDPNHSHFVLAESDKWGGEIDTMFQVAQSLADGIPVVFVLVNGGPLAKQEALRCVRQGYPIIVIEGSGRLADEIAKLWREKPSFIEDPVLAEIVADGNIHIFPQDASVAALERLVIRQLGGDTTLRLAWERFALYDANAKRQQVAFNRLQLWILALGVLGTLLALTQKQLLLIGAPDSRSVLIQFLHQAAPLLRVPIVLVPITTSILLIAANRFKQGNKYALLRASAEALKSEIYAYRARAGDYRDEAAREPRLAQQGETVSRQMMQTDVNMTALVPYEGPIPPQMYGASEEDDGMSSLTPDRYVMFRLGDQLSYYRLKTVKLERQLRRLQWATYIIGGAGTFLAAIGLELWIALTTALVTALTAFLEYQLVENSLMKYNQAATDLANVRAWWTALSAEEQANPRNVDSLVGHTERIVKDEFTGWVQKLQDTLAQLRAERTPAEPTPPAPQEQTQPKPGDQPKKEEEAATTEGEETATTAAGTGG